jgi:hypothetical protein
MEPHPSFGRAANPAPEGKRMTFAAPKKNAAIRNGGISFL